MCVHEGAGPQGPGVSAAIERRVWELTAMDYRARFSAALDALHKEGRYRVFADIKRACGAFPTAVHYRGEETRRAQEGIAMPNGKA